jgi:hypothetical protein
MSSIQLEKSPADVLDYDIHYDRWLPPTDIVASAVATITGSTAVVDTTFVSPGSVKVWISGGALNENATVTVVITTAQGRVKEACFRLRIKDCS